MSVLVQLGREGSDRFAGRAQHPCDKSDGLVEVLEFVREVSQLTATE